MSDTPAADAQAAGGKPKSKLMLIIIIAVVVLAGGGGGAFFYLKRSKAHEAEAEKAKKDAKEKKAKAAEEEEEETAEHESEGEGESGTSGKEGKVKSKIAKISLPDDSDVKTIIELQPFVVNLADSENTRYLRMSVSLGVGETKGEEKPDQLLITRVRNAMLALLTTKKSEEVLTPEGKIQLRKDLLRAARAAVEEPKIEAIYITDFIVQL